MQTKTIVLITGIVLGVLIVGFVIVHEVTKAPADAATPASNASAFPAPTTTAVPIVSTIAVQAKEGTVTTTDFEKDPETIADASGEPVYYLSGGVDPSTSNAPYQISYDGDSQTFSIILYAEPIGQYRVQAENELMQRLQVSESDLCRLNAFVEVVPGVNDAYLGKNMGFSFCPGATPLPQ